MVLTTVAVGGWWWWWDGGGCEWGAPPPKLAMLEALAEEDGLDLSGLG